MGWVFRYRMGGSQGKSIPGMAGDFMGKMLSLCGRGFWLGKAAFGPDCVQTLASTLLWFDGFEISGGSR